MHLVQILLPLFDNAGKAQSEESFRQTERELVERFGGVTAFVRSPGEGRWKSGEGKVNRDKVAICEVMVETLDQGWWSDYRAHLEDRFKQKELVERAMLIEPL